MPLRFARMNRGDTEARGESGFDAALVETSTRQDLIDESRVQITRFAGAAVPWLGTPREYRQARQCLQLEQRDETGERRCCTLARSVAGKRRCCALVRSVSRESNGLLDRVWGIELAGRPILRQLAHLRGLDLSGAGND
jgi:hypothetical protein